jgi:transposase InsO family protein
MKGLYRWVSLSRLCRLFKLSRQAYYQHFWLLSDLTVEQELIVEQVKSIRQTHPVLGARKLYCLLQPFLIENQIKMGRDALFDLLAVNKLLVRKKKRAVQTTFSRHWFRKYPNLTKNWRPGKPNQLWVADITYVPVRNSFLYLNLITDAYSHRIMGASIGASLASVYTCQALEQALENYPTMTEELIHHSDRGFQYCCSDYVNLLHDHRIKISMTQTGDPLENPVAERINGIIKNEYLTHLSIHDVDSATEVLPEVIRRYNDERPHESIGMQTPSTVHQNNLLINRNWPKRISCKPIPGLIENP